MLGPRFEHAAPQWFRDTGTYSQPTSQPESEDNTKAHKNVTMALPVTSQLDPTSAVDIPIRFYGIHLFILFIRNTTNAMLLVLMMMENGVGYIVAVLLDPRSIYRHAA